VSAGLAWLAARGDIRVEREKDGSLLLEGGQPSARDAPQEAETRRAWARVEALLAETAAYRAFFRSAEPGALLGQA